MTFGNVVAAEAELAAVVAALALEVASECIVVAIATAAAVVVVAALALHHVHCIDSPPQLHLFHFPTIVHHPQIAPPAARPNAHHFRNPGTKIVEER